MDDAAEPARHRSRVPLVVALAAACAVAGLSILRVEQALGQAHAPDRAGGTLGTIASPRLLWDPRPARDVAQTWHDFGAPAVQELTHRYLLLDTVFMLTIGALLLQGLAFTSRRRDPGAARRWPRIVSVGYVLADAGETYLASRHWISLRGEGSRGLEAAIGALSLAKWLLLAAALFVVVPGLIRVARPWWQSRRRAPRGHG